MARALRLAERGLYTTQPNPRVGCVIALGSEVVGEGWHRRAGEPHAEIHALRDAGERALAATAYVSLEPCAHVGKTPPCVDALITAGIARVVVAHEDPFPRVNGRGIASLRAAGIAVDVGLLRDAARELNRGFLARVERKRPWVRVKLAMSLDGRTALRSGESKWISGAAARADVARWRARSSAVLTSVASVLADDPRLTVRFDEHHPHPNPRLEEEAVPPLRVVLDATLRTPSAAAILNDCAPILLLCIAPAEQSAAAQALRERGAEIVAVATGHAGRLDLNAVLTLLAQRGVNELQVEAGATLCGALFAQSLVDELLIYISPVLLGDSARPLLTLPTLEQMTQRWHLRMAEQRQVGDDMRVLLRTN